jgi:hypothetical protein
MTSEIFVSYIQWSHRHTWKTEVITEYDMSASCLDNLLDIDSNGRLTTTLYDERDDFNFVIVNFPFLYSNIPLSPTCDMHDSICKKMFYVWQICKARPTKSWCYRDITNLVYSNHFANSLVAIYNDLMCDYKLSLADILNDLFHAFFKLSSPYWLRLRVTPHT